MVPVFWEENFFFATCCRQIKFFCAKNIFSSHLATMATGSANPAVKKSDFSMLNALISTKLHSSSKPRYFAIHIF